jgi:hypothetical protein
VIRFTAKTRFLFARRIVTRQWRGDNKACCPWAETLLLEVFQQAEAGAELPVDGWPGNRCSRGKAVQPVCEPNVYVDCHRTSADGADRFLANWHGVLAQRLPESLIKPDAVLPQRRLPSSYLIGEKGQPACRNTARALTSAWTSSPELIDIRDKGADPQSISLQPWLDQKQIS